MQWGQLHAAWAFAGLPLLFLAYRWQYRRLQQVQHYYSLYPRVLRLARVRHGLLLLAYACAVLALMDPQLSKPAASQPAPLQVMMALDASQSMEVQDLQPSRLAATRQLMWQVARQLEGQQLGLIGFADFPYTYVPFTRDLDAFELHLRDLDSRQFSSGRTQLRYALRQAYAHYLNLDTAQQQYGGRVLLLFTDAESREPSYESWLLRLAGMGVKLIPVLVGTEVGGPVPRPDGTGYYLLADGSPAISRPDRLRLDSLAARFGQQVYRLQGQRDSSLAQALAQEVLATPRYYPPGRLAVASAYQYPLLLAVVCFLLSFLAVPKRSVHE
ncbi:MAG: VWA domain-containing protein [Bacteroidetes bacterium]|nr:VWA domain-containing protein [Bacteroidota bacterium]